VSRIKVENVEEAIRAAEQLKRSGRPYWFRGQRKDWPVRSSLLRLTPEDRNLAMEKIARYDWWIKHTPGLENLAANADPAIAVAQHYGLPTNFVDFTTNPEVAGFFASEMANSTTAGDMACIICLDVQDFKRFWQLLPGRYPPPEFLELMVPDLWRLEAQQGRFLYCPYENVEHLYDFDRILFPNTHPLEGIIREDVYPDRKSHLEILLAQYFMNETMTENMRGWNLEGITQYKIEVPKEGCEPEVFPKGLPEHPSWTDATLRPWVELRGESYRETQTATTFEVIVSDLQDSARLVGDVSEQVMINLFSIPGVRDKIVKWQVQMKVDHGLPDNFGSLLAQRLSRLWDGLRRLPYENGDMALGLGKCVAFAVALGGDFRNPNSQHWESAASQCLAEPVELEFGAEDGIYSRGYASTAGLTAAVRPDILSYVADQWRERFAGNIRGILQTAWTPRKTFDFGLLTPIFAREIAPFQVLARDSAIFYSPARLVSLGLP
jgi:hypothetical protein